MVEDHRFRWRRWGSVVGRSLLVGAMTGLLGGAIIFFIFGFIGFAGAPFATRVENGWDAVLETGLRKGLAVGLGIAVGLAFTTVIVSVLGRRIDPIRSRNWLSSLAAAIVVIYNLESLRNSRGLDLAGLATVFGIAALVGGIVWLAAPWVLRDPEPTA